jgi:hypothetical protein
LVFPGRRNSGVVKKKQGDNRRMKKITKNLWLARDRDHEQTTKLFVKKPQETNSMMFGNYFVGERTLQTLGLRPGQCKKVKVTIEEVE